MVLAKLRARSTIKIDSKNSLYPYRHFTEQLVDVFRKSPRESDLNHKSSSLLIRRLKNNTGPHLQQFAHKNQDKQKQPQFGDTGVLEPETE
jgi:hypothetical protein